MASPRQQALRALDLASFIFVDYYHEYEPGAKRKECEVAWSTDTEGGLCVKGYSDKLVQHVKKSLGDIPAKKPITMLVSMGLNVPSAAEDLDRSFTLPCFPHLTQPSLIT